MSQLRDKYPDLDHLVESLALSLGYGDSSSLAEAVLEYRKTLPLDHVKACRLQLTELLKHRSDIVLLRERVDGFKNNIWRGPMLLETWAAELLAELKMAIDCDLDKLARGSAELERQRRNAKFVGKSKRKR